MEGIGVRVLGIVGVLSAFACGPTTVQDSGTNGATSGSTTSTGAPTDSSADTTGPCGPLFCGPCSSCSNDFRCVDGQWQCSCRCEGTSTGEPPPPPPERCPSLEEELSQWVSLSKVPAVDCGTVDGTDGPDAWTAVQACVIEQSGAGAAYSASWRYSDVAPEAFELGAAGRAGALYEEAWFEVTGFYTLTRWSCGSVEPPLDCIASPGDMCLMCIEPGRSTVLCDLK